MASKIGQATIAIENNAFLHITAKTVNDNEKKKIAFGDIKNAPVSVANGEKFGVKKSECAKETVNGFDNGYASSMPVDYFEAWVDKMTLSDDDIDRWIKVMNDARKANPYDETEPPMSPIELAEVKFADDIEEVIMPPPLNMIDATPASPGSDSSDYRSCSEFDDEDEMTSSMHNSKISALNMSVFELSMSDDEDDF